MTTEEIIVVSLADAYPKEQARLRELIAAYKEIPTGAFGAAMIEQTLKRADKAAAEQDTIAMIRCYDEMRGCE